MKSIFTIFFLFFFYKAHSFEYTRTISGKREIVTNFDISKSERFVNFILSGTFTDNLGNYGHSQGNSTVLLKKEILGSNRFPDLKTKEDFVLWLKLISKNVKIYALDKELTLWRKTSNSLSSSLFQKIIDGFRVYYTYMNFGFIKSIYYLICLSINFLKK